ncbi:MAG: hypothetical protein IT373_16885 [Polyangiaceae bacterium]|nr:hypothetical protein [Polyangiaceae bacterium]
MQSVGSVAWVGCVASLACALALGLVACRDSKVAGGASSAPPPVATVPAVTSAVGPEASAPLPSASAPLPSASASSAAPPLASLSAAADFKRVFCGQDAECGWDDRCMPTRCGAAVAPGPACEETSPPPGTCGCLDYSCTLVRSAPAPEEPCRKDDECGLETATGRCRAIPAGPHADPMLPPAKPGSPYCACRASRCTLDHAERVECQSDADCGYVRSGHRVVPVRAKQKRPGKFRPCVDGEIDSQCRGGVCQMVGWSC